MLFEVRETLLMKIILKWLDESFPLLMIHFDYAQFFSRKDYATLSFRESLRCLDEGTTSLEPWTTKFEFWFQFKLATHCDLVASFRFDFGLIGYFDLHRFRENDANNKMFIFEKIDTKLMHERLMSENTMYEIWKYRKISKIDT